MGHAKKKSLAAFRDAELQFRKPGDRDGQGIHDLINQCPPLDTNSIYCNLLQCTHFADTCVVVEKAGKPIAFLSAYILPNEPDTLFVWQVAVHREGRGQGLGKRMLAEILDRPECKDVKRLQTTITRDNKASWGLFESFANNIDAECRDELLFCRKEHFSGAHASEHLLTISFPK